MHEVRRPDDGELCGYVDARGGRWSALTVFGAVLGEHAHEDEAQRHVAEGGLAALADRWTLVDGTSGVEQVVCILQVSPGEVSVALDHYALPGTPTATISVHELASGRWRLEHREPASGPLPAQDHASAPPSAEPGT
ncbi:MAG TPA: hypothetical protein VFW63_04315 [Acidimicrobiales bacterium]|nr:hypothetical protein [Acidimicrobiales bacterium]